MFATGPITGMTTPTNFPSESQVKAFRVDLRCTGMSMKSQLYSADKGALHLWRQRHACVQGGASSLGCGVTIMTARTRGLASRPVARISRNDRTGLTRCAVFLLFLIAVHAVGNLHVFKGPGEFNVYDYFYVRLYWTGFGFQANLVEESVLCSALLHDSVGLEGTWVQELSPGLMSGQLNLAITGLMLLTVITILLFLLRFADTEPRTLRSPPTLINWYSSWLITSKFSYVSLVPDRDISLNEYKVLKNPVWCGFYIMAVVIFMTHAAEFDMIHPPDVVEKYVTVVLKNPVWCGFYNMAVVIVITHAAEFDMIPFQMLLVSTPLTQSSVHVEMEEGRMTKKVIFQKEASPWKKWCNTTRKMMCGWCWDFWSLHPGGELAILTFAGEDNTTEYAMLHPPDVVEKNAADAIRVLSAMARRKVREPRC